MIKRVHIEILPENIQNLEHIKNVAILASGFNATEIEDIQIVKRSVDARQRPIYRLQVDVFQGETHQPEPAILQDFSFVENKKKVVIIGAGPAGYFAALELIALGLKPIVLDRGKDVRERRKDLRAIQQFGEVNPHSNYCFGEGGAGTYSDGKLYTRSHKRGKIEKVLKLLVEHGAMSDILIDAHPHIGSNKLPKIVANIRETILKYGGEVHFNALVTDFLFSKNKEKIIGVTVNDDKNITGEAVILATGHSARDIFELLHQHQIHIEAKPFALGVRIEHPQPLIDFIQYKQKEREQNLPASSYGVACQVRDRGVFSFCMCPGGLIVPAATAPNELVVNGMSLSRRDSPFANSGMVVAVELEDLPHFKQHGVFAALAFQKSVEKAMFNSGDGSQKAPAQRMTEFVNNKPSNVLNDTSYIPGLHSAMVSELLPPFISKRLREGMKIFGKQMKGYFTEEANVIGTESRTSSPIKVPRNKATFMHEGMKGLFPCGEGAGYAGGILSAAMDGQNVAKAVALFLEA